MRYRTFGAAALLAAAGAAAAIVAAPAALADDSCDPAVAVCEGGATPPSSGPMDFSPAVQAPADDYPGDGDWYFGSPGPNEPAYSIDGRGDGGAGASHGGGGGGGGGHR